MDGLTRAQVEIVKELTADVERVTAENKRLRGALKKIADMCPATQEITLSHEMADTAIAALAR